MRIVLMITVLEGLVLTLWLLLRRYYKNLPPSSMTVPLERSLNAGGVDVVRPRNAARWAFVNGSPSGGQANDRGPMINTVAEALGSPSARRSSARRSHQLKFKQWSTERHD